MSPRRSHIQVSAPVVCTARSTSCEQWTSGPNSSPGPLWRWRYCTQTHKNTRVTAACSSRRAVIGQCAHTQKQTVISAVIPYHWDEIRWLLLQCLRVHWGPGFNRRGLQFRRGGRTRELSFCWGILGAAAWWLRAGNPAPCSQILLLTDSVWGINKSSRAESITNCSSSDVPSRLQNQLSTNSYGLTVYGCSLVTAQRSTQSWSHRVQSVVGSVVVPASSQVTVFSVRSSSGNNLKNSSSSPTSSVLLGSCSEKRICLCANVVLRVSALCGVQKWTSSVSITPGPSAPSHPEISPTQKWSEFLSSEATGHCSPWRRVKV